MVARNDITGDSIMSIPSKQYQDNYDSIFRKDAMTYKDQLNRIEAKLDMLIKSLADEDDSDLQLDLDGNEIQLDDNEEGQSLG